MQRTYRELFPGEGFDHLAHTVEQYFSGDTPLWWVQSYADANLRIPDPVACLWMGSAVDQVRGDRHAHIFLLYVSPEHRRRGIGTALMRQAEDWARLRGDRQMGLHVFCQNQPAQRLYESLGFVPQSIWMVKPLDR
ncbi:GNAT family N-acetyltransferase [Thermoleptolyngbya oregonensis NK1-22]|uniref:GNAT family N-acetyltransferase n=2 Tax=Thermoleptolyngbya TaxID=2303528 RepID=A0AA97BEF5_9CYAN|nr:GNAT family N-acetyltransferase [Thermoleptolyngbya oregonensis NK1-22]